MRGVMCGQTATRLLLFFFFLCRQAYVAVAVAEMKTVNIYLYIRKNFFSKQNAKKTLFQLVCVLLCRLARREGSIHSNDMHNTARAALPPNDDVTKALLSHIQNTIV